MREKKWERILACMCQQRVTHCPLLNLEIRILDIKNQHLPSGINNLSYKIKQLNVATNVAAAAAKSLQLWLTLCDPLDGSLPGSAVTGILQARILEWAAISFY